MQGQDAPQARDPGFPVIFVMLLHIFSLLRDLYPCQQDFFQKCSGFHLHQLSRGTGNGLDRLPEPRSGSAKLFQALSRIQGLKIGRHDEHINIAALFGLTTGMGTKQNRPLNPDA
jgi:hypothetical protein